VIDQDGFRHGVAIVLINNKNRLFWARRVGSRNAWQFPQGGVGDDESFETTMFRELYEEIGLKKTDVEVLASSKELLTYRLPDYLVRHHMAPICIGQKQKWFLLRLIGSEDDVNFNVTDSPEFDYFRWVSYWFPAHNIIDFKRDVYQQVLREFAPIVFGKNADQYK